jgi:GNAT superfamily N-acetyltransferase
MANVVLRAAQMNDAEVMLRMLRSLAWEIGEGHEFEATLADVRRHAFGDNAYYETILAEADESPAALATFFTAYSTYKGQPYLYVNDLFVDSWARGLGLGRLLMARVCNIASQRRCCRVELKVLDDNLAREFYERIGMVSSTEVPYHIRDDVLLELAATDDS